MQTVLKRRLVLGIGLLELMLSLAIIAILLIMATRYYQSASENNKRNQAVDMFSAVNGAVQSWKLDQTAGIALTTAPSIDTLVKSGYLPPSYGTGTGVAPWGGTIATGAISSGAYTITMDNIPGGSCEAACNRVSSTIATIGAVGGTGGEDGTVSAAASCKGSKCTANYNF